MEPLHMYCNFQKCRQRLTEIAWVTSCSHAFCEQDGSKVFSTNFSSKCPACDVPLEKKYDVVRVDLNPSDSFKSMVLAGLRPETIAEIMEHGISFWNYQVNQEYMYQKQNAKRGQEKLALMEKHYESIVQQLQTTVELNKKKLRDSRKEVAKLVQRTEELKESLNVKCDEVETAQKMYKQLQDAECGASSTTLTNFRPSPSSQQKESFFKYPYTRSRSAFLTTANQGQSRRGDTPRPDERKRDRGHNPWSGSPRPEECRIDRGRGFVFQPVTPQGHKGTLNDHIQYPQKNQQSRPARR